MAGHTHVGDTRQLINYLFAQGSSRQRVASALGIPIHYLSGGGHIIDRKFDIAKFESLKSSLGIAVGSDDDDVTVRNNTRFQLP